MNGDENIDNELQNPPHYPNRNRRQPERLTYNHLGEPSNTSYVMSTHLQTRPSFANISYPCVFFHTGRHQGPHFLIIVTFYHYMFHTVLNS